MSPGLFGFRAIGEAADLDVREVAGLVRSGHGDRLVGMVLGRQSNRRPRAGGERFIRSAEEITVEPEWDEFIRSADEIV